jgi:hypothetical protein
MPLSSGWQGSRTRRCNVPRAKVQDERMGLTVCPRPKREEWKGGFLMGIIGLLVVIILVILLLRLL